MFSKKLSHQIDQEYNRSNLMTEKSNIRSKNLDVLQTHELFKVFNDEDIIPQKAVTGASAQIIKAIDEITKRLKDGGRLFYLGAGTSGRLGVLDAVECPPTFCTSPEMVQAYLAGGIEAMFKSSEGAEDDCDQSIIDLNSLNITKNDILIGITAGGTTPYVVSALTFARELGTLTVAISCVPEYQSSIPCDIDIRLLTGPELITGSTRLKAGTATKMTLNIISSSVMIKLGKVYGNKMIDLSVTNNKLLDRALRIITDITGTDRENAFNLLSQSDGSVKVALAMHLFSLASKEAKDLLIKHKGNLRAAVNSFD